LNPVFKSGRKLFKKSMIRSALAERIIRFINTLRGYLNGHHTFGRLFLAGTLTSYFLVFVTRGRTLTSYFSAFSTLGGTISSNCLPFLAFFLLTTMVQRDLRNYFSDEFESKEPITNKPKVDSRTDWIEDFGRDGIRVAEYLRVSTGRQAKGFSLDAQREQLEKLKTDLKPSRIYGFIDAGKSGIDFDKRKLNAIMELKEKREIDELWVASVDRIGRECRKLLLFFLNLCDDGVIIRTPERKYDLKDLSSLLTLIGEAHDSQKSNEVRAKAVTTTKIHAFKLKHWNKPVPIAYRKAGDGWLEKIPDQNWETIIKDAYALICRIMKLEFVKRHVEEKYHKSLTRHQIKRILTDSVYMGKPQHLGEVVLDSSLAYVDEETFLRAQKILEQIHQRHSRKHIDPIRDSLKEHGISALDFYDDSVELHHRGCGGRLDKNGTETIKGIKRQLFLCTKCGDEFKVPKEAQLKRIRELVTKQEKLFNIKGKA
jgi:DNA invertase Pin-like site-specific DNA recombinase